ncbi:hypothetical protein CHUAL_000927 [Chamberlinius hualienensis]
MSEECLAGLGGLDPAKTVFLLCDMQEKFRPVILHFDKIAQAASKLIQVGNILGIPLIVTEQYPKGLGSTVPEIDISHARCVVPKTKFSMVVPEVEKAIDSIFTNCSLENVVLFGVESHVCIEQTAMDFFAKGITVHVVANATSSRTQEERLLAFQRMRQIGCFISTFENIVFKLVKDKDHPKFNDIRGLVKDSLPETGLVNSI